MDVQSKAVAGASVTLRLADSPRVHATTRTLRRGRFLFPALRPALYDLTVEAPNFSQHTLKNIKVDPAAVTSLPPIRLAPAGPAQRAEAKVPDRPIPTGIDLAFAANYDQFGQPPLPARDALSWMAMLPGVQNNGRAPMSLYGVPATLGNLTYDGINVLRNPISAKALDPTTLWLRTDQISEATVLTGAISGCGCAQPGFSSAAGGNAMHGAAYWLTVPPGTAAQYWADNSRNTPRTTSLNQLGARFGGAMKKDRLFFYLNYEADLDRSTVTRTGSVPVRLLSSRDPLMQQVLDLIPADPSGRYRGRQDDGGTTRIGLARLDYAASARNAFGLTFAHRSSSIDDPEDSSAFGSRPTTSIAVSSPFASAFWRWSPTARLTNEVRVGASLPSIDYQNSLRPRFGFIAILNDPAVAVSQPMTGMDPQGQTDRLYSYQDNFTWMLGRHTLHAGTWFQQYRLDTYGFNDGTLDSLTVPRYTLSDIALGTISGSSQRFNITSPESGYSRGSTAQSRLSSYMLSGYLQEDWRLLRSLNISLGMRYDYLSPANERTGTALIPDQPGLASHSVYDQNVAFSFASTSRDFYNRDIDNYSHYAGLSWRPAEKLPLMVRGGYSVIYVNNDLLPNMSTFALRNPFQSFDVSTSPIGAPLSSLPATPAPVLPSNLTLRSMLSFANSYHQQPGTVYAVDTNIRTPNVKYWNVGIETQAKGFELDVRYVGNRLEEGPRAVDRNEVMLSPAFLAAFGQVRSALKSGAPTSGFAGLLGGGLCANFSLQNCQPDLYARSLILSGQPGELGRWLEGQGYNPNGAFNFLGNPLAPQGISLLAHLGASRYDALQFTVSRRIRTGPKLMANYAFSKALGSRNDSRPGAADPFLSLHNPSLEWAPSPFNLRHALKALATWDLPFLKSPGKGAATKALGGWSVSGIVIAQSGAPFSLLSGGDVVTPAGETVSVSGLATFGSLADSGQNPVVTSLTGRQIQPFLGIRKNGDGTVSYVNAPAGAFAEPGPGALGNLPRRMFSGPGAFNLNLGLRKSIRLSDRARADFRAESINVLNNVNWLVGDQVYLETPSAFDNNVSQWNSPRTIQLSLRVLF